MRHVTCRFLQLQSQPLPSSSGQRNADEKVRWWTGRPWWADSSVNPRGSGLRPASLPRLPLHFCILCLTSPDSSSSKGSFHHWGHLPLGVPQLWGPRCLPLDSSVLYSRSRKLAVNPAFETRWHYWCPKGDSQAVTWNPTNSTHWYRRFQPQNTQDIDILLKHLSSSFPGSLPILPSIITHYCSPSGQKSVPSDEGLFVSGPVTILPSSLGSLTCPGHSAAPAQKQAPSPMVYQWGQTQPFQRNETELSPLGLLFFQKSLIFQMF